VNPAARNAALGTPRAARWRRSIFAAGVLQLLSCGGGEDPPQCPTGDCNLPGRTIVKWIFDAYPELLFPSDTCIDMGAFTVRAEVTGIDDPTQVDAKDVQCGQGQVSFLGLAPGSYEVAITPLDFDGNPIVKAPVIVQAIAGTPGADTDVTINVPYEAWTGTYTGTFLFRLSWAGVSCEIAVPAVTSQTLTLTAGGQIVTALTDLGQKLDGTDPKPCRALTEPFAQFTEGLPFGPATLVVVGKDTGGAVRFRRQFETFVGAAKNNPTITFDVPPPDAGVDAPPDAPPDAPVDASIDAM